MRVVGIDFSMSCPAVTIHEGSQWSFDNCSMFFLSDSKRLHGSWGPVTGSLFKTWMTDTERFLINALALKEVVKPDEDTQIVIEGYAFGATGSRVFQIAEATGILKTLLIHDQHGALINHGKNLRTFAPSAVKKYATGKGNADKQMMYDAFVADTGCDLVSLLGMKRLDSPAHDLSDAYFIAKMAHGELAKAI